ncbi:MAG: hypothetical protein Q8P95_00435 [bacterium]|nr:hypothetical protein [bacterium]
MLSKLRLLTIVLDYLLLLGAMTLAYFLRVGFIFSTHFPFWPYFKVSLLTAAAWIIVLLIFRGYSVQVRFSQLKHLSKVIVAGLTGTALFGLIFYFWQKELFSRLLMIYIFVLGTGLMTILHLLMVGVEKRLIQKGYGNIRLLIIGSNREVKSFIEKLKKNVSPYVPVAILDGYGTNQERIGGVPVLGKLNILEQTVEEERIDAIVQGDNVEQVINIVHFCKKHQLKYFLLPYLLGMYQEELSVSLIEKPLIGPKTSSSALETILG